MSKAGESGNGSIARRQKTQIFPHKKQKVPADLSQRTGRQGKRRLVQAATAATAAVVGSQAYTVVAAATAAVVAATAAVAVIEEENKDDENDDPGTVAKRVTHKGFFSFRW